MSRGLDTWYSWPDLERLARLGRTIEGEIELGRLTRLVELLSSPEGTVNATLSFGAGSDGRLELRLTVNATVELVCQRCLEPFRLTLTGEASYLLAEDEVPDAVVRMSDENMELLVLGEDRLNPSRLIEDELLLSLPLVPRHDSVEACGHLAEGLAGPDEV